MINISFKNKNIWNIIILQILYINIYSIGYDNVTIVNIVPKVGVLPFHFRYSDYRIEM